MADPVATQTPEQAKQQAEAAAKARADAQAAAIKKLDEDDKARAAVVVDVEKRRAQGKPTPTQRESDLAKLGLLDIDKKEDDGSGPDPHAFRALSPEEQAKYKNRDMSQPKK